LLMLNNIISSPLPMNEDIRPLLQMVLIPNMVGFCAQSVNAVIWLMQGGRMWVYWLHFHWR
jgi:hypothetical protein